MVQHAKCCSYRISNGLICGATHSDRFHFLFCSIFFLLLLVLFVVDIWYGHKSLLTVTILLTPVQQIFAIWISGDKCKSQTWNVVQRVKLISTRTASFRQQFAISIKNPHVFIQFFWRTYSISNFYFDFWFWLFLNRYCYSTLFLLIFTVSLCLNRIPCDDFYCYSLSTLHDPCHWFDFSDLWLGALALFLPTAHSNLVFFSLSMTLHICECKLNTPQACGLKRNFDFEWNWNWIEVSWARVFSFLHARHFTNREQYTFQHTLTTQK